MTGSYIHQEYKYRLPKGESEPNNCKLYCIFLDWVVETSHKSQPNLQNIKVSLLMHLSSQPHSPTPSNKLLKS